MNKKCAQFGNLCVGSWRACSPSAVQQELTKCSWETHGGISNLWPASVDLGKYKYKRNAKVSGLAGLFLVISFSWSTSSFTFVHPLFIPQHASDTSYFIP